MDRNDTSITIVGLFFNRAPNLVFLMMAMDALSGAAYALIIPLVLGSIDQETPNSNDVVNDAAKVFSFEVSNYEFAVVFATVVVFILITTTISKIAMERVASHVVSDVRIGIYGRIVMASVAAIERIGPPRIMAALVEDVPLIVSAGRQFPVMLSSLATLLGMLGYLAYLNASVFWFVLQSLVVGVVTYQLPVMLGRRFIERRREFIGELHRSTRALLDGFKELKLDRRKRDAFMDECLREDERNVRDAGKIGGAILAVASTYGDLINLFVIGFVSFVFVNYNSISSVELVAVVMTLLYITAPVAAVLHTIPGYVNAGVSLQKVNQLLAGMPEETARPACGPGSPWTRIRFDQVIYQYERDLQQRGYTVGPVSFEIEKGKITFITGGNGSGKSTLGKLITLHYLPKAGSIYFGDDEITDETLNVYRQKIGCIYSDYHLFERVLLGTNPSVRAEVDRYLKEFDLADKVTFKGGRFSDLRLSDGQRRRLALIVAFVEDKELYLFDEWAADQDPLFKRVFYEIILQDLKCRGKAVIVVSHDDRYFSAADALLIMDGGKLINAVST